MADDSAQTTRKAQEAAQSKGNFLAMMSHEIRTPLNGILGMTAVLLARELDSAERDCVEIIRSSGEALLSIVDDVLDFSKIEAGRLDLECAPFEVAAAVHQAIQIVHGAAARKGIRIGAEFDPALPSMVRGDICRLRQILLNLLSNAIKFTENGDIQLKVELASFSQSEYELRFCVADEGIGITEEQQARLFQPFSQAEPSTKRKFGGTGLGLAICKRLVEIMGGTIDVTSQPGQGSSFSFTIRTFAAVHPVPMVPSPCPSPAVHHQPVIDARVLLVEDNAVNQKVALHMLKNLGLQPDIACNGEEALQRIAARDYDLVLMDCIMPEMDGFEATRRIRAAGDHGAQVPIIAMTANAFVEDRKACLSAGMTDYLSKPVRQAELSRKLEFWLSQKEATSTSSAHS